MYIFKQEIRKKSIQHFDFFRIGHFKILQIFCINLIYFHFNIIFKKYLSDTMDSTKKEGCYCNTDQNREDLVRLNKIVFKIEDLFRNLLWYFNPFFIDIYSYSII